jgi:hydrogenase maturation protein HypF
VAALAGIRQTVNYEAQAAIELENAIAEPAGEEAYKLRVMPSDAGPWIIDTKPLFVELIDDLRHQLPVPMISAKFHQGLVDVFAQIAQLVRERENLNRVCLSGGTFQNRFLAERLQQRLSGLSFEVFAHSEVPAGDGGLSLGQALVAAYRRR